MWGNEGTASGGTASAANNDRKPGLRKDFAFTALQLTAAAGT